MAALLLSTTALAAAAFVAPAGSPRLAPPAASRACAAMVAAPEVFSSYVANADPLQKGLQKVPPPVSSGALTGVVAATAAVGYVLTPSTRLVVNALGGSITGGLGLLARGKLADVRREAAATAVATALAGGLGGVTPEQLGDIGSQYNVPKPKFQRQLASLFGYYLSATISDSKISSAELKELLQLKALLRLSAAQAGTEVYTSARALYSRHRAYLEDDEPNDSKELLSKFIFYAERVLSKDESEEGYRYEATRLQRIFGLSAVEWTDRSEAAAVPFYEGALSKTVLDGVDATPAQLSALREAYGISDECAAGLHAEMYAKCANQLLDPSQGSGAALDGAAKTRLDAVASQLGLADADASKQLRALTSPLYRAAADETVAQLVTPEDPPRSQNLLVGNLATRQENLLLGADAAWEIEREAARDAATKFLDEALKYLRAQNNGEAVKAVQGLLGFSSSSSEFFASAGRLGGDAAAVQSATYDNLAEKALKESEIIALYRVLLLDALDDLKIDADEADALASLRPLLGLADERCASVYEAVAGPLFRKAVTEAISGELSEGQKIALQQQLADLALPDAVTSAISADLYEAKLRELNPEAKIMNEEQARELETLRDFLSLDIETVQPAHAIVCGPAYRSAVAEVFGVTGIVPDEYWTKLDELRVRLGLSEASAEKVYTEVAKQKMRTFGEAAVEQLQQKMGGPPPGGDAGDDPLIKEGGGTLGIDADSGSLATEARRRISARHLGAARRSQCVDLGEYLSVCIPANISANISQVLNLVDFAQSAKILIQQTVEIDGELKDVDACSASLKGQFSDKTLQEIYRQYLIEAFSGTQAAQNQRLFNNLNRLALVLGLNEKEIEAIHNSLGGTIFRNYLSRTLSQGGGVGEREYQFLNSIRDALGMEQEKCDELVRDSKVHRVSVMVEQMFERGTIACENVRKMRDTADQFEVSLTADLDVSVPRLEKMFTTELMHMVDEGELVSDDLGALEEVCESLHVSEERASALLDKTVKERCSAGVLQATALLRQGATDSMMDELRRVIKYASLRETQVNNPAVSVAEKNELIMLFQANALTEGVVTDESKAEVDLLKSVIGVGATDGAASAS